ncbi:MAG TPA: hypothetical protein VN796_11785 [Acidimicrobiales bacterium]|nr:hypothetical protein [Acidimicrobiales bacterium]
MDHSDARDRSFAVVVHDDAVMTVKPYEILASAVAALAAAAAASVFGVKGTLIGAAIGAAVATTVASLVAQSAARAHGFLKQPIGAGRPPSGIERVEAHRPRGATGPSATEGGTAGTRADAQRRWRWALMAAASALGAFVLALGLVTVVELSAGRSLSSIFGGPASGTTVGGVIDGVSPPSTTTTSTTSTTSSTTTTTTTPSPTTTTSVPGTVPSTSSPSPSTTRG